MDPMTMAAMAGGGGASSGGLWAMLSKLLGGGAAAGGATGGATAAAPAGMNLAGMAGQFGAPGTPGAVNGAPMMRSPGMGMPQSPQGAMAGGQSGGGAAGQMGALNAHQNMSGKVNDAFNSLRAFGQSLGGVDKTPLNNIPRNQPPIIYPQNNQNPGVVNLQALMAAIAGGAR